MKIAQALSLLAATLPHREVGGEGYVTRYTLRGNPSKGDPAEPRVYLHEIHRADHDKELHNHPWQAATCLILSGGYVEERLEPNGRDGDLYHRTYLPGSVNVLIAETFHRIDKLLGPDPTWTLVFAGPRVQSWGFLNIETRTFTDWEVFVALHQDRRSL